MKTLICLITASVLMGCASRIDPDYNFGERMQKAGTVLSDLGRQPTPPPGSSPLNPVYTRQVCTAKLSKDC